LINSDVQLFWANNENNDIVIIYDMDENDRSNKYTCPVCGSEVRPVAIGGKRKDGKVAQVSSHFSHFDASKCNNETAIHWWFKNKILINGDNFIVKTDVGNEYKCKEVLIEQSYNTSFGIYRPDITITTECGKTIYFEMNYTNKKKVEDYLDKWLELGNPVVEVDLKTLMNASFSKNTYEFRALFYEGKCFNTKKSDVYYDTIGQFKEKLCKNNGIDDTVRERIKKLDWFWMETINYKRGETNIEQLTDYIDSTEQDERDLIMLILSKKRCVPIYEDYINYKVDLFEMLALDCINDFENGIYKECFMINKIKVGRKYRNIKFNSLIITNKRFFKLNKLEILVDRYSKSEYIETLTNNINETLELSLYFNKIDEIYLLLQEKCMEDLNIKYIDNLNLLKFNTTNDLNNDYLCKFSLEDGYTSYCSIYISIDHIRRGGDSYGTYKGNDIKINLLNDNLNNIVKFIFNSFDKGLLRYQDKLFEREIRTKYEQEQELLRKQKLLMEIENDKKEFRNILCKIVNILEKYPDKIIDIKLDYSYKDKVNLLYFKDYRGYEFVVYSNRSHINAIEPKSKYEYYGDFWYSENIKFLQIGLLLQDNIYIYQYNDSYQITNKLINPKYSFPYLNNPKINFSFREFGYNTKLLLRYDFMYKTEHIDNIIKKIIILKNKFIRENEEKYSNNIIYDQEEITDEEINNDIYKCLYPIICLSEKNPNDVLNVKLNIDFTVKDGKKQPWLIKQFIESLNKLGINNIHNII